MATIEFAIVKVRCARNVLVIRTAQERFDEKGENNHRMAQ